MTSTPIVLRRHVVYGMRLSEPVQELEHARLTSTDDDVESLFGVVGPGSAVQAPLILLSTVDGACKGHAFSHRRRSIEFVQDAAKDGHGQPRGTVTGHLYGEGGAIRCQPRIAAVRMT